MPKAATLPNTDNESFRKQDESDRLQVIPVKQPVKKQEQDD